MRVRLMIMARVPYTGGVKRRLAVSVGAVKATRYYRRMLVRAIRAAREASCDFVLAQTPDHQTFSPNMRQGYGDLGQRMERLLHQSVRDSYQAVIFMASDLPTVSAKVIDEAMRFLRSKDVVIAPAGDGGYSLIGMRVFSFRCFRGVRWSTVYTLEDTLRMISHQRVGFLPTLPDVDELI